jgi:hypothetical protein
LLIQGLTTLAKSFRPSGTFEKNLEYEPGLFEKKSDIEYKIKG